MNSLILLCKIVFDFDNFILRRKSEYGTIIEEQNPDVGFIALCIHIAVDVNRLLFIEGSAVHKFQIFRLAAQKLCQKGLLLF